MPGTWRTLAFLLSGAFKVSSADREWFKISRMPLEIGTTVDLQTSLLGRPLNHRFSRKDACIRRWQSKFYNFLERPRGAAVFYHILV